MNQNEVQAILSVRQALVRLESGHRKRDRSPGGLAELQSLAVEVQAAADRLSDAFAPASGRWVDATYFP